MKRNKKALTGIEDTLILKPNLVPKKPKIWLYVAVGAGILGAGVAGYFVYQALKKKKEDAKATPPVALPPRTTVPTETYAPTQAEVYTPVPSDAPDSEPTPSKPPKSPKPPKTAPTAVAYNKNALFIPKKYMPEVKMLQKYLISRGVKLVGGADGMFGDSTQKAVASRFSRGVYPNWVFASTLKEVADMETGAKKYFSENIPGWMIMT